MTPASKRPLQIGPDRFRFLNKEGDLSEGWDPPSQAKLWRYNLHYFDDLNAEGAASRCAWHDGLVSKWLEENPAPDGTGWEPYPTSLRIVNWVKWGLGGASLSEAMKNSLAVQARWLSRRLEVHLLGNHLFANAKALAFSGCFFLGDEAEAWLEHASSILNTEIREQILADGGQFELSPMYHALALEDVLDLLNLARAYPQAGGHNWRSAIELLEERVNSMRRWLATMSHPDGGISFFNDAAIGIAPSPAALESYASRLDLGPMPGASKVVHLADSGYVRVESGDAVALIDCARIGPDYLPGHAHADTLAFELSLAEKRLLVNSGTSLYESGRQRSVERGTSAHNTVEVDGLDSSEVWSSFRVARRAYPRDFWLSVTEDHVTVRCAHDGYERLSDRPWHWRELTLRSNVLLVLDRVTGPSRPSVARFHFHPDWSIGFEEGGARGALRIADRVVRWHVEKGEGTIQEAFYSPEFGITLPTKCLAVRLIAGESAVRFEW